MFFYIKRDLLSITSLAKSLIALVKQLLLYPTPFNLTYLWNFGSLAMFVPVSQPVSGIFSVLWYPAELSLSFDRIIEIVKEVEYGWLIRFVHLNCAAAFFSTVYVHIFRALYFSSYLGPRTLTFISGYAIYLILMFTAFLGYVLPAGQMSYWAFVVITSFSTTIP